MADCELSLSVLCQNSSNKLVEYVLASEGSKNLFQCREEGFNGAVWWKSPGGDTASFATMSCKLMGRSSGSNAGSHSGCC